MKKILFMSIIFLLSVTFVFAERTSTFDVNLVSYDPQPIQPGQVMDIYFEIVQQGQSVDNGYVKILEEYPFILEESQDALIAQNLQSVAQRQKLHFRIRIANDAKDGMVPLRIRYGFNDQEGFVEKTFNIVIETFDARIDVVKIVQNPKKFLPGEEGDIIFTVTNLGDTPLNNVDMLIDFTNSYTANTNMENTLAVQAMINARLEEVNRRVASGLSPLKGVTPMSSGTINDQGSALMFSSIAPVGMSNQKRINSLGAGESIDVIFRVEALGNSIPGVYALPLYINYNDEDNNPFHVRLDIPIKIDMEPELFVTLSSTKLRTTDFASSTSFSVANRGLTPLKYVTVSLIESDAFDVLVAPQEIYLGLLEQGEMRMANFTILAHENEVVFPVKVTYRDAYNQEHSDIYTINYTIVNRNYYRDVAYEMSLAWIILGIVVFLLTLFYVYHLSKKSV